MSTRANKEVKVESKKDDSTDEKVTKAEKSEVVAKAGKRSAKSIKEEEQKATKEAKKTESKSKEEQEPKPKQKPRVKKYTKNHKSSQELIQKDHLYSLKEAVELLPKISKTKFDASAELHVTLNIDPKQADQIVRTSTTLPSGTGKTVKLAVIASDKDSEAAKQVGADLTDAAAIMSDIKKEKFDFDILIATPDKMGELGKLAKVLGPKGLMPSPKNGTVSADPAKAVTEFKKGKVEIKNDANGVVHVAFGKTSFKTEDLYNNLKTVVRKISTSKPSGVKGVFIRNIYVSASMSPSIKIDQNEAIKESKTK